MAGHEMGEFTPKGELDRLVEATGALTVLLQAYNGHYSLSDILADLRTHTDIVWDEVDEIDLRLRQSMALSTLLVQYEGSTTLVEIIEDIKGMTPSIDGEEGEYSQELVDPRYLRIAGDYWVDEGDGKAFALGMVFVTSPTLKRKPGDPRIYWRLVEISEDGRKVMLKPMCTAEDGTLKESSNDVLDEIPYGAFRDLYLNLPETQ